jgi:hypothetical protein
LLAVSELVFLKLLSAGVLVTLFFTQGGWLA